jgi:hypothetical protein
VADAQTTEKDGGDRRGFIFPRLLKKLQQRQRATYFDINYRYVTRKRESNPRTTLQRMTVQDNAHL